MLQHANISSDEAQRMEGTHVPGWAERKSLRHFHAQTDILHN